MSYTPLTKDFFVGRFHLSFLSFSGSLGSFFSGSRIYSHSHSARVTSSRETGKQHGGGSRSLVGRGGGLQSENREIGLHCPRPFWVGVGYDRCSVRVSYVQFRRETWAGKRNTIDSLNTKDNLQRKLKPNLNLTKQPMTDRGVANSLLLIGFHNWVIHVGFDFTLQLTFGAKTVYWCVLSERSHWHPPLSNNTTTMQSLVGISCWITRLQETAAELLSENITGIWSALPSVMNINRSCSQQAEFSAVVSAIVSYTGISNKTLSLFGGKLASYVRILVQISSPYG